jgi:hypothetical protein
MVLTAYFALPGDRAFLPPSSADYGASRPGWADCTSARLDASVGASGPHDFAVRSEHHSSVRRLTAHRFKRTRPATTIARMTLPRPPHPVPNVRDDRDTPLCVGRDGGGYRSDLGQEKTGIFLRKGLDTGRAEQPVGQIRGADRCKKLRAMCCIGTDYHNSNPHAFTSRITSRP